MKINIISLLSGALAIFIPWQAALAEDQGIYSLETGMDYSTGKYGGTLSTDILYIPIIGKYQGELWTLKLTIPYLRITGPDNLVNGIGPTGTPSTTRSTRSGLGDVVASATRIVHDGGASGLVVDLAGKVKFGTASSNSGYGLGTGKNDYSIQTDVFIASDDLYTFVTAGYKVHGSPAGYTLYNVFFGSLGWSYRFDPATQGGLMFDFAQKSIAYGSSQSEVVLFYSHKLDQNWKSQLYLQKGFTSSVPDFGAGTTLAYVF